jgi:hypothetical protein
VKGDVPVRIDALVMQLQHRGEPTDLREAVWDLVVTPTFQDARHVATNLVAAHAACPRLRPRPVQTTG